MIKKTDLMVGNLLNYHTSEGHILPSKMDWQDFKWIDEDEKGFNFVHSAISITEELLINVGAMKIRENSYNLNGMQINLTNGKWIEYVHQIELEGIHHLQNVFYFIMGKELIFEGLN